MRVRVAGEERGLIEGQANRPDSRRPAKPGEDSLSHQRLNKEDQEGREKDRHDEDEPPEGAEASRVRGCGVGHRPSIERAGSEVPAS